MEIDNKAAGSGKAGTIRKREGGKAHCLQSLTGATFCSTNISQASCSQYGVVCERVCVETWRKGRRGGENFSRQINCSATRPPYIYAGMKSINDLSTQELEEARQISADKLRRILFADIEVVPDHKYNHINMNLDAAAIHTSSGNSSSAAATHPTSSCTSPAHHSPQHSPNNMQTHHQLRRPSPNHQQHSLVAASAFPSFTKSFQTIDNNMENSNFISSTHHLAHFLTPRRPDVRNRGSASTLFIGTTGVPSASGFSNEVRKVVIALFFQIISNIFNDPTHRPLLLTSTLEGGCLERRPCYPFHHLYRHHHHHLHPANPKFKFETIWSFLHFYTTLQISS